MVPFLIQGLKKFLSTAKKIFIVIAVFVSVITLFSYFISKDKTALKPEVDPIKKNRAEIYKIINDKELNSTQQGKLSVSLYGFSMCKMIGEACSNNPSDGDKNFENSTFGFISKLLVVPFSNPPASGIYWVYSSLESTGFIPKTFASEGIGFAAIQPFSNIWKIFRDLSYMFLVIILISIGFMIMFRMKMNPQTVISVENALPRIIIALILITFSFAIAGFIIDLTYILMGLIVSILSNNPQGGTYYDATQFKNEYMLSGFGDLLRDVRARFGSRSVGVALGSALIQILPLSFSVILRSLAGIATVLLTQWIIVLFTDGASSLIGLANVEGLSFSIGGVLKGFFTLSLFPIMIMVIFVLGYALLLPVIVWLLIGFSILLMLIRLSLLIFTNYLKLIVNIVIAPLLLMLEAVPGRSAFKNWLLSILSSLIAYPIMVGVFVLSYLIVFKIGNTEMTARLPYLGGIDSDSFRLMIGLGLIFLIPDFVKAAKEALGIKDLPFTIGVGTFFGGVTTGVGSGVGLLGQIGSVSLGLTALTGDSAIGKFFKGSINSLLPNRGKGQTEVKK